MPFAFSFRSAISLAAILAASAVMLATSTALAGEGDVDWNKERQFWAFRPPVRAPQPVVQNAKWARQPLDYLVLAKIEENKLAPAPAAEWRALVRRVALDLTGLPLEPSEAEHFLANP